MKKLKKMIKLPKNMKIQKNYQKVCKRNTKHEKIKTFQKEFTSQILKFNDLYFDPKIDDFYNDKLFNDVKATCDLFINKFHIDSEEEKNSADLDNYL